MHRIPRASSSIVGFLVQFLWLFIPILLLAACQGQNGPSPSLPETPTGTGQPVTAATSSTLILPIQEASATPAPALASPTPQAVPTDRLLEPLLSAPAIRLASWSPEGDWLAYWVSSQGEAAGDYYPFPPGELTIRNILTGQECPQPGLVASSVDDRLTWQQDGTVSVSIGGRVFSGSPCQGSFGLTSATPPPTRIQDPALSPGGDYRAETTVIDRNAGILSLKTTLLALPDNQVINSIEWKIDERLGDVGLGGKWLAGNQFLIYETLDQGPLLATVSGEVTPVARQYFGIEKLPSLLDAQGVSLRADGSQLAGTQDFHIALYGVGQESNFPPARLYHSENSQVEEMPFRQLWSPDFSSDGRWLLLDERPIQEGAESHALWVRPVDPAGSPLRFFAAGVSSTWSSEGDKVGIASLDSISVYTFPEGEILGTWKAPGYTLVPLAWSPDGSTLVVHGQLPGQPQQALFLVQP